LRALRARVNDPFGLGVRGAALGRARRVISSGLAPLDAVLPGGGLPGAALAELLFRAPGTGVLSLALHLAVQALEWAPRADNREPTSGVSHPHQRASRCIFVIDSWGDFHAAAAAQAGLDPQQLIVLRLGRPREALWALEQALRCAAVAAVIASFRGLDDRDVRRLQLAAERGGTLGLVLLPFSAPARTFAAARILVERSPAAPESGAGLRGGAVAGDPLGLLRLTVLKVRDGFPSAPLTVDLHHETGDVSLHPVSVDGPAAQTGTRRTG
jgi:protein ImuA